MQRAGGGGGGTVDENEICFWNMHGQWNKTKGEGERVRQENIQKEQRGKRGSSEWRLNWYLLRKVAGPAGSSPEPDTRWRNKTLDDNEWKVLCKRIRWANWKEGIETLQCITKAHTENEGKAESECVVAEWPEDRNTEGTARGSWGPLLQRQEDRVLFLFFYEAAKAVRETVELKQTFWPLSVNQRSTMSPCGGFGAVGLFPTRSKNCTTFIWKSAQTP